MSHRTFLLFVWAVATQAGAQLLPISDEFNDPATLSNWSRIHETEGWNADQLEVWDIDASQPGRMVMKPYSVTWFQNHRGPLVYKTISGNFSFTTQVEVRNGDNLLVRPTSDYSLAGVMLRRPTGITDPATQWAPGGEDYVFLSLGFGHAGISNGPQFEVKTTNDSVSILEITPAASLTATLQLSRLTNNVGTFVIALLAQPEGNWQVYRRYLRNDLAGTIQAGLVTYTDYGHVGGIPAFTHNSSVLSPDNPIWGAVTPNPDLIGGFEYARYFDLGDLPAELMNVDLRNTVTVPNSTLLQLLGANSSQLTGDYNNDGVIDAADYVVWRDHLGNSATLPNDPTPGSVTGEDYDLWRTHFGESLPGPESASGLTTTVPEPSAAALLLLLLLAATRSSDGTERVRTSPR